jgi:prepilin-type N-terminal cleavage/methylation domain-containing protein
MGDVAEKVMPRISGCCLPTKHTSRRGVRAYTLLEILVVLVLLSLAIGTVGPAVSTWHAATRERGWRSDLKAALDQLPVKVFFSGQSMRLDAAELDRLVPGRPTDMRVELERDLVYQANGMTTGGTVRVQGLRAQTLRILPLTGEVVEE